MIPWITVKYLFYLLAAAFLYTFSSYVFLSRDWTFMKSFVIAMFFVSIEYNFSLRGNKLAYENGLTAMEILLITIGFYYIALVALNKMYIKDRLDNKDFIGFMLVLAGMFVAFKDKKLTKISDNILDEWG